MAAPEAKERNPWLQYLGSSQQAAAAVRRASQVGPRCRPFSARTKVRSASVAADPKGSAPVEVPAAWAEPGSPASRWPDAAPLASHGRSRAEGAKAEFSESLERALASEPLLWPLLVWPLLVWPSPARVSLPPLPQPQPARDALKAEARAPPARGPIPRRTAQQRWVRRRFRRVGVPAVRCHRRANSSVFSYRGRRVRAANRGSRWASPRVRAPAR